MNHSMLLRNLLVFFLTALAGVEALAQPVTLTTADLFNQPGQYYYAYCNEYSGETTNSVAISSAMLGTANTNTAQFWDWSSGPTNLTFFFEYIPAAQGTNGADFVAAGATVAQRQTNMNDTNDVEFLYMKVDPGLGQLDYGFYDPAFSAAQPESFFTNGLQDFPNHMTAGTTWAGSTSFSSVYSDPFLGDYPDMVIYTSADVVDAYGYVNLPGSLGIQPCLRVHESVQYDIYLDLTSLGQPGWTEAGLQYGLNYYWLVPGLGIAVQINAMPSQTAPVPDNLPNGAQQLVRTFQAYHPVVTTKTYIQNFKISHLNASTAFLSWASLSGAGSYTVQYTTNLASSTNWVTLSTTASNFALDPAAFSANAPRRFYRVMVPGPK